MRVMGADATVRTGRPDRRDARVTAARARWGTASPRIAGRDVSERDARADMDRRNGVYERFVRGAACARSRCCRQKRTPGAGSKGPGQLCRACTFSKPPGSSTVPRPRHSTEAPERAPDAMSEYETRPHVSGLKRKALVGVEYVPKKEDMAEGPFVCRLGAAGGLPPPGTEFRAWRKNLPYRGHMMPSAAAPTAWTTSAPTTPRWGTTPRGRLQVPPR